ncbi:MAG: thiamine pyrophosphate-binding protein [Acidobacteriia bacterium]|nr:thiamine pyrophosphate-binding protein [Terriglobia bacterium]MYG04098.1 thiamine pyrophosphate-binding protein [Terriglobia bacterium]MYK08439.1 thiamine pyrophosphate-binding protein [Terriglobia bacterium]
MQQLIQRFLNKELTRRGLSRKLAALGLTAAAAQSLIESLDATESADKSLALPPSEQMTGSGGKLVMEQAKAAGSEYLFTNPGSFEVGLFDAQVTSGVPLIMGLHEGIVVAMADGYHRASLKPAFVNVHVIAGTAQMGGQLYNASRDGAALVVTAGMLDNELWSDEGILAPRPGYDQKDVPRQFTKFCWEARNPQSLTMMLRRAYKVATTPPGGPVYLAMTNGALEAQDVRSEIVPAERFLMSARPRPEAAAVEQTADWLAQAKRPLIVVGDEVWKSGAQADLVKFAEAYNVPVTSGTGGYFNFPSRHPLHLGRFSMRSDYAQGGVDLALMVGARDFGIWRLPTGPEAPMDARIVRIGLNAGNMGRNYPTDLALLADVKASLADLDAAMKGRIPQQRRGAFGRDRGDQVRGMSAQMWNDFDSRVRGNFGLSPMHPDELTFVMAKTLDRNAVIVGEVHSGYNQHNNFHWGYGDDEQIWIGYTGNSLGWGLGAATGAKLAMPDRQVVCSIGDGAVMYQSSALWSQARYGVPVLNVVWNNLNYQTVRGGFHRYNGTMAATGKYAGMYLGDPDIDFVQLAASQGVKGERATTAAELEAALKRGQEVCRAGEPYLVEAAIRRIGAGADSTWHEGFRLSERIKTAG